MIDFHLVLKPLYATTRLPLLRPVLCGLAGCIHVRRGAGNRAREALLAPITTNLHLGGRTATLNFMDISTDTGDMLRAFAAHSKNTTTP